MEPVAGPRGDPRGRRLPLLGGHSLLALVVTDDLREELGVELSLADFFTAPTVADQAALVERALLAAHPEPRPYAPENTDDH
ncbi:phosphopantetheine-binding protein [Streptomyces lydicus]|nr:phosphopantetheine-binding protein [Streptomyces lydicus]